MTLIDDQSEDGGLVERVEALLSSLTAVVSARVMVDEAEGTHVHIIATSEVPLSEVSRSVMSALNWGLGFELPSDNITIVQSRMAREELQALLSSERAGPASIPAPPKGRPSGSTDPETAVPNTRLREFSLGGAHGETPSSSALHLHRLQLQDLQLDKNPQDGFSISVRLVYNDRSIGAQREAAGTERDLLQVPASTTLGVIQEFLRAGREDCVVLRFLAARRLSHPQHDTVVVLVEAVVRGRRIPLTGAASANEGVERAAILATLQATNAFVAGSLVSDSSA